MKCCRVVGSMWATVKHPAYAGRALFVAAYAVLRAGARPTGAKHFFVDETHFNAAWARTISPTPRAARPL